MIKTVNTMTRMAKFFLAVIFSISSFSVFSQGSAADAARSGRRMLLRDEGLSQLSLIDLAKPTSNWMVKVPPGRDIQLVGGGRVLIGTGNGYEEHDISTGTRVAELATFPGTISARRLRNGNTILAGMDWQGKKGIVLAEVNKAGAVVNLYVYPAHTYLRLVRETANDRFLITADELVFEGNKLGEITWRGTLAGLDKPHSWQAVRLGNGRTLVSTGYNKNFQIFSPEGKLIDSINAPEEMHPVFFAGFQILANGNYIVTNWQGHGPGFGASGHQVLEFNPNGKLVWSWKQDPTKFSSLQGIIVLDGLDLNKMHIEDASGKLAPVATQRK
ncbi:MAG: hypothetical protein ABI151_07510 [Chitinophagaceae bacterium]